MTTIFEQLVNDYLKYRMPSDSDFSFSPVTTSGWPVCKRDDVFAGDPQVCSLPDSSGQSIHALFKNSEDLFFGQGQGADLHERMSDELSDERKILMLGMAALTLFATGWTLTQTGVFDPLIKGSVNLFNRITGRTPIWEGLPTLTNFGTNLTEEAQKGETRRAADATTADMAERIENRLRSTEGPGSAVFEAPEGWGEEVLMRDLALRNPDVLVVQIRPYDLSGMLVDMFAWRARKISEEIDLALKKGQPVWIMLDQFELAAMTEIDKYQGKTLLEHWSEPLASGTLRIAGFSTPLEMLKLRYVAGVYDAPSSRDHLEPWERDALSRFERDPSIRKNGKLKGPLEAFQRIQASPRTQADIVAILEDEIKNENRGGVPIAMDRPTLELIAKMSLSDVEGEGYNPRRALDILHNYSGVGAQTVANPLTELLTYPVNDATIEAALRHVDPGLADYYRSSISSTAAPITTLGDLARNIAAVDPVILIQAGQALAAEGLSLAQAPERFLFEVVARAAAVRGGGTSHNPAEMPALRAAFETEVRRNGGAERRAADPADAARREAEEREHRKKGR